MPRGSQRAAGPPAALTVASVSAIDAVLSLVDPADVAYRPLLQTALARFAAGDQLVTGVIDELLVAWGWVTRTSPLPVTELGAALSFPPGTVLCYDFNVIESARGRGHYVSMLKSLPAVTGGDHHVIYALSDHAISRAGIEAAGFMHVSTLGRGAQGPELRGPPNVAGPTLSVTSPERHADEDTEQ